MRSRLNTNVGVDAPRLQLLLAALVAALVLGAVATLPNTSAAFTDSTTNAGNSFTATASIPRVLHLHNDPTPPVGNTASHDVLPLDSAAPTATTLYNYDTDHNSSPGIVIGQGDGLTETNPVLFQRWQINPDGALDLDGPGNLDLWTTTKSFATGKTGAVGVALYDCNAGGTGCSIITTGGLSASWPSSWTQMTVNLGTISHTIAAGRSLVVHLYVPSPSEDSLWFAFDTTAYDSTLRVG